MQINREGIWMIRGIKDGIHKRFMSEKLEDLPEVIKRASIEPYRKDISKELNKYLDKHRIEKGVCWFDDIRTRDIVNIVFNCIKK